MIEHKLLLIVAADRPNDASLAWRKANVVAELACAEASLEKGAIVVSGQSLVKVRALHRELGALARQTFADLDPGQWIEVAGKRSGPVGNLFIPASITVRHDLPTVPAQSLPKASELHDNSLNQLSGKPESETIRLPVYTL